MLKTTNNLLRRVQCSDAKLQSIQIQPKRFRPHSPITTKQVIAPCVVPSPDSAADLVHRTRHLTRYIERLVGGS